LSTKIATHFGVQVAELFYNPLRPMQALTPEDARLLDAWRRAEQNIQRAVVLSLGIEVSPPTHGASPLLLSTQAFEQLRDDIRHGIREIRQEIQRAASRETSR
jgi:hypothetical protein